MHLHEAARHKTPSSFFSESLFAGVEKLGSINASCKLS